MTSEKITSLSVAIIRAAENLHDNWGHESVFALKCQRKHVSVTKKQDSIGELVLRNAYSWVGSYSMYI